MGGQLEHQSFLVVPTTGVQSNQGALPAVGKRHSHIATAPQQAPGTQQTWAGNAHQAIAELMVIMTLAICLARKGMARCVRHSRTMGPKRGCARIQCS